MRPVLFQTSQSEPHPLRLEVHLVGDADQVELRPCGFEFCVNRTGLLLEIVVHRLFNFSMEIWVLLDFIADVGFEFILDNVFERLDDEIFPLTLGLGHVLECYLSIIVQSPC